jgi:hypothetical protein
MELFFGLQIAGIVVALIAHFSSTVLEQLSQSRTRTLQPHFTSARAQLSMGLPA